MRVLLAFDKFKDALTARRACEIAARELHARHPAWQLDLCPLADGGEGFAEILTHAAGGRMVTADVAAPRGGQIAAAFGLVPLANIPAAARALLGFQPSTFNSQLHGAACIAVIEMAAASGLALLPAEQRDPWHTTTLGTGQLIRAAMNEGATLILLGVGGSATNDLGLGALEALGLEFLSTTGEKLSPPIPDVWPRIASIAGKISRDIPPLRIACDVSNPLLGANGCAAIYGPQKGLRPADQRKLEHASARLALMLTSHCEQPDTLMDTPGAGAAGGIAFGLMTAANAKLLPGSELVSTWLNLEARIAAADLVITGEGRFDASSLNGKGPGAVATRALLLGKRTHIFAGAISAPAQQNLHLHAITPASTPLTQALRDAPDFLARAVAAEFS